MKTQHNKQGMDRLLLNQKGPKNISRQEIRDKAENRNAYCILFLLLALIMAANWWISTWDK